MDWSVIIQDVFKVCIIPLLGIFTKYFIDWINLQKQKLVEQQDNELKKRYIEMLAGTIETCVIATNQTYVDNLKNKNAFTPEAQQKAFESTKEAIFAILGEEGKKYLSEIYGDLNTYISKEIEKQVNWNKIEKKEG